MVLYKRSGRFCPRISTLIRGLIQEIRGRWRWEAPSDCAVAPHVHFQFNLYGSFVLSLNRSLRDALHDEFLKERIDQDDWNRGQYKCSQNERPILVVFTKQHIRR